MFLGIEIGGTKLQFGVGSGDGPPLAVLQRIDVEPKEGAQGILGQIEKIGRTMIGEHEIEAVGIGFGGPVDTNTGRTITSHQIDGWDDFPIVDWCREKFALPTVLSNDSDAAGLAEALFGAGKGSSVVFYTNVGSGIGGALVIDGNLFRGGSGIASELGHVRPGLDAQQPHQTIESIASGWGITAQVRARLASKEVPAPNSRMAQLDAADLLRRAGGQPDRLNTKIIARAAEDGNHLAQEVFGRACRTFGWGIAQVVTLLAPNVVVVGGGVSLVGEDLFLMPLRDHVNRYVFPPLAGTFEIRRANLGEEVVLYGILALAATG
jgi:glucokinase